MLACLAVIAWVWKAEPPLDPPNITLLPKGELYAKWLFIGLAIWITWALVRRAIKRAMK
jgi:hypothetical protein